MLDPQILAQYKDAILQTAAENYIKDVRIFGKHIGQQCELQSGVNFIIIPEERMTSLHKRNFELTVAGLLSTTLEVFTPKDLNGLAKDEIITADQAQDYLTKSIKLEDFFRRNAERGAELSNAENIPVSSANVLAYLEKEPAIWDAINRNHTILQEALDTLVHNTSLKKQ